MEDKGLAKLWTVPAQDTLSEFQVSSDRGLDAREIKEWREWYGLNRLQRSQRKSAWQILVEQFKSLVVALLMTAGDLSFVFGELQKDEFRSEDEGERGNVHFRERRYGSFRRAISQPFARGWGEVYWCSAPDGFWASLPSI